VDNSISLVTEGTILKEAMAASALSGSPDGDLCMIERNPMTQFQITFAKRPSHGGAPNSPGRFSRLKSGLLALLAAAFLVGIIIVAIVLGWIIASVILGVAVIALIGATVNYGFRRILGK
jgi:hypothetical protein